MRTNRSFLQHAGLVGFGLVVCVAAADAAPLETFTLQPLRATSVQSIGAQPRDGRRALQPQAVAMTAVAMNASPDYSSGEARSDSSRETGRSLTTEVSNEGSTPRSMSAIASTLALVLFFFLRRIQ